MFRFWTFILLAICLSCSENHTVEETDVYVIDNQRFKISPHKRNAQQTTDSINAAISWAQKEGYKSVRFQPGDYLIQSAGDIRWAPPEKGIRVPSDITLDLADAHFYLEPNSNEYYGMFHLDHVENVKIIGGHLIGDRDDHKIESGSHEYGFGINIISSKNILLKNLRIEKMMGDAIILTSYGFVKADEEQATKHVEIIGCELFNCRRQGVSVVNATDVEISHNTIYDIRGTDPQFGIDIEPEVDYGCVAKRIKIHHNNIRNCVGGISFHGGTDMEAYENNLEGLCLLAIYSQRVRIYKNTVSPPGYISAGKGSYQRPCQDICIVTEGDMKNDCKTMVNYSIQTGAFSCP